MLPDDDQAKSEAHEGCAESSFQLGLCLVHRIIHVHRDSRLV